MFGVPASELVFWRNDTCTVRVSFDDTGALVFYGDESAGMGDEGHNYEYWVTVPPHQFDLLRRALAAGPDAAVVDLVCANADEIMARGERSWLDDHGIERGFSTY
jgi:hypothetical protein